jgi:hypothetical protein
VNVTLGGIDIGHHLVDRDIAVGRDPGAVAVGRLKAVDGSGEREWSLMLAPPKLAGGSFVTRGPRQSCVDRSAARAPLRANPRLAEDQIGDDAEQRDRNDNDDPGEPGRGFAVRAGQCAEQDGNLRGNEESLGDRGEGGRGYQLLLSPVRWSDRPPNRLPLSQR